MVLSLPFKRILTVKKIGSTKMLQHILPKYIEVKGDYDEKLKKNK